MSSYPVWDDFWKGKLEHLVIGKEIPDGEKEASQVSIPTESEFFCRTCSIELLTREEQVKHYKSAEHRSLLKSKLKAKNVTEDEDNESGSESDTGVGTDRPKKITTTVAFFECPVFMRVFVGVLSLFVAFLSLFLSLFETKKNNFFCTLKLTNTKKEMIGMLSSC
jgi:hypothetical protein